MLQYQNLEETYQTVEDPNLFYGGQGLAKQCFIFKIISRALILTQSTCLVQFVQSNSLDADAVHGYTDRHGHFLNPLFGFGWSQNKYFQRKH